MSLDHHTPVPADQDIRDRLVSSFDRNLLVEASAGSGKTTVLVERLVQMLALGHAKVGEIAALTFTRKAAGELRSRFLIRLESARHRTEDARVKKRLKEALDQVHQAFVGTIHSFCGRLLREYSTEAGMPAGFEEVQADDEADLQEEVWNNWLRHLSMVNDPIIPRLEAVGLSPEDLRDGFIQFNQYSDVEEWPLSAVELPVLMGLRERLTEYHQHMQTLGPKLPSEVNDRLMQKYRRLPRSAPSIQWHEPHQVLLHLENYDRIDSGYIKKHWPGGAKQFNQEQERWNEFCDGVTLPLLQQWRAFRYPLVMEFLKRSVDYYRIERHRRARMTFQDLLLTSVDLIRRNAQVRLQLNSQWKRLLVDEFQDTDPLQAELLFLLTSKRAVTNWLEAVPKPGSLLLVGDPKQSIYRFRRADIQVYQQVKERLVANGGEVLHLTSNFRSQPALVEWINDAFSHIFTEQGAAQVEYTSMQPGRVPDQTLDQSLRYLEFQVEATGRNKEEIAIHEAEAIARYIQEAMDGHLKIKRSEAELARGLTENAVPDDFMILSMFRDRLQLYGDTISQWGIENQVTGGAQLNSFPGLRLLYLLLLSATQPSDQVALLGLLRSEICGLSDAQLFAFKEAGGVFNWTRTPEAHWPQASVVGSFYHILQELARNLQRWPVMAALERTIDLLGLPIWAVQWGETGAGCLAKALICIRETETRTSSIQSVLVRLERLLSREPRRDGLYLPSQAGVGVRIMNLHKAKGLESPVVILADAAGDLSRLIAPDLHVSRKDGFAQGYMNVTKSLGQFVRRSVAHPADWPELSQLESQAQAAEKARLLYVAATRARDVLVVCTRTASEGDGNRTNPWRQMVPFLGGASLIEPDSDRQPRPKAVKLQQQSVSTEPAGSLESVWNACMTSNSQLEQFQQSNSNPQHRIWAELWQSS